MNRAQMIFENGVIFTIGALGSISMLALLIGAAVAGFHALRGRVQLIREQRAAAKLEAERKRREAAARKWGLVPFNPSNVIHIPAHRLDPSARTGQFSVPKSMRDAK